MSLRCLAVDSDLKRAGPYFKEWAKYNIIMDRVDGMAEAIIKLCECDDYIFVGINGDKTNYIDGLCEMRSATDIPILIVVSEFSTKAELEALKNGANLFARWHPTEKDNVESVLAHIDRITEERKTTRKFIYCNHVLMAIIHRTVFVCNKKIILPRQEFDVLHMLMANRGTPLSYDEIYRHVWGQHYKDETRMVLRNTISRLRKRIRAASNGIDCIKTERDFGYSFISTDDN